MQFYREFSRYPSPLKSWVIFLTLFPFYFFDSGLPQVADWLLIISIQREFASRSGIRNSRLNKAISPLKFFAFYTALIALIWFPFVDAPSNRPYLVFLFPAFYYYNLLVVWFIFTQYSKYGQLLIKATLLGTVLSVFLQLVLLPISLRTGSRDSLFFNNPNQLGYYSLLCLTIFLYCEKRIAVGIWTKIVFLLAVTFFAAVSTSKATLISSCLLIIVNFVESGLLRAKHLAVGLVSIGLMFVFVSKTEYGTNLWDSVSARLLEAGTDSDDNLAMRGYDRIWNYPEHLIIGAGEGGWERFYWDPTRRYEMHSTFGTLIFSYGIPGTIAFFLFIFRAFKSSGGLSILYALPVFAYGVTHMGLRFSLFWAFFAMVAVCSEYRLQFGIKSNRRMTAPYLPKNFSSVNEQLRNQIYNANSQKS
jgi:hypothetical protein